MSFLIDPPMLVISGAAIERLVRDQQTANAGEIGTLATLYGVSTALYFNAPGTGLTWKRFGSSSGHDLVLNWNSIVFAYAVEAADDEVREIPRTRSPAAEGRYSGHSGTRRDGDATLRQTDPSA